jgi:multidrug transporter EmrE-like cation transporter
MSDFGDQAKSIIATYAPTIGLALGGPLGGLAGGLLAKVFGAKNADGSVNPADPKAIEKAILGQDPATFLALKQAENELTEHMRQFDITEEQLQYQDVDSARKREMAVKDFTPMVLAYLLTLGFFGLVVLLIEITIPARNEPVVYALVGTLGTAWTMAIGYYFGSSKGSTDKTAGLIAALQSRK